MDDQIKWRELLKEAVNTPGIISDAYSAFWSYSVGNQLYAMIQCAGRKMPIGPIATYPAWLAKGRQVRRGEKAIELCMPITRTRTKTNDDGDEEEQTYATFVFRRNWFVLSQTDGPELAPESIPTWDIDKALAELHINPIPFELADGNAQGYAKGNQFAINPLAEDTNKTTFHELAHIVLGHTGESAFAESEKQPHNECEMEAEAVAMILCESLGIGNPAKSRGYIQSWYGSGREIPEKNARRIFAAVDKILKAGRKSHE